MTAYVVGQEVVVVDDVGRNRNDWDATVSRVGPKWITVKYGHTTWRFDHDGEADSDFGNPTLFPSRAEYEASALRARLWDEICAFTRSTYHPPEHLEAADLQLVIEVLRNGSSARETLTPDGDLKQPSAPYQPGNS